ncbi:MAG: UxaA family hydrolase, partial [Candidatus Acidiferrales bacterium]
MRLGIGAWAQAREPFTSLELRRTGAKQFEVAGMQSSVLKIDPRDNVLIALKDLRKGDVVDYSGTNYELVSEVPAKHKFVTADLAQGDRVIMYGVVVGKATEPLRRGQALTT